MLYFTVGQGLGNVFWMKLYDVIAPDHLNSKPPTLLYGLGAIIIVLNSSILLPRIESEQKEKKKENTENGEGAV